MLYGKIAGREYTTSRWAKERERKKERKKESEAEGAADRVHPCAGGGRSEAAEWGLPVVGEASERASESEAEE